MPFFQDLSLVKNLSRYFYERRFIQNRDQNLFRGVYSSAAQALASAPKNLPIGYDNPESAAMYLNHLNADSYDYPAIFWMQKSFHQGLSTVFDVGGHIGIKYYAFGEKLDFPADLLWTVCDVAAVVQRGKSFAAKRDKAGKLRFSENYADVSTSSILFASGVLQYLPMTMGEWLKPISPEHRPKRIIFNTTAIHPTQSFFTLNSISTAYCPYKVTSEGDLYADMKQLGYELRDRWTTPGKGALHLPLEKGMSIEAYSGFVFDLGH